MSIRDEILLEERNKKNRTITLLFFLFFSSVLFRFGGRFDNNPFKLRKEIKNILELKFSSTDLVTLGQADVLDRWINVRLIEKDKKSYAHRVKIKPAAEFTFDFKLNLHGTIYNLHRIGSGGKDIYDFFKTAGAWGLESSSPQLIQLKINNVLVGIYMMEENFYDQVRDEKGGYFIRLNSNTLLLKRILYQVRQSQKENTGPNLLFKYFHTGKLAAYMVFFSLFCYNEALDFDRLVFRYDPEIKKFVPFLTMESIILSLQEQNKTFKIHPKDNPVFFNRLNNENIKSLLSRVHHYKYGALAKVVLRKALKR